MKLKIEDKSTNELPYKSRQHIIYEADYYFKEVIISKGIKKVKEYKIFGELYCDNGEEMMQFRMNRFLKTLKEKGKTIKGTFTIEKIVLTNKIGYSNLK